MGQRIDDEIKEYERNKKQNTKHRMTDEEIADEYGFPDK